MSVVPAAMLIPQSRKQTFLESLTEDDSRDKVIRPLFYFKGYSGGRDTCGVNEQGKDCYFFKQDDFNAQVLYVVQTKRGDLNLSRKPATNLIEAITQLKTAIATPVKDHNHHREFFPSFVFLAASGKINQSARDHIVDQVADPRIRFLDATDILPDIDRYMPELWNGISVEKIPYLKRLRDTLLKESQIIDVSSIGISGEVACPILDDTFSDLFLHRYHPKVEKQRVKFNKNTGKNAEPPKPNVREIIDVEEIKIQNILQAVPKLILVIGDAGSGKTTSLHRLAMILIENGLKRLKKKESRYSLRQSHYHTPREL